MFEDKSVLIAACLLPDVVPVSVQISGDRVAAKEGGLLPCQAPVRKSILKPEVHKTLVMYEENRAEVIVHSRLDHSFDRPLGKRQKILLVQGTDHKALFPAVNISFHILSLKDLHVFPKGLIKGFIQCDLAGLVRTFEHIDLFFITRDLQHVVQALIQSGIERGITRFPVFVLDFPQKFLRRAVRKIGHENPVAEKTAGDLAQEQVSILRHQIIRTIGSRPEGIPALPVQYLHFPVGKGHIPGHILPVVFRHIDNTFV